MPNIRLNLIPPPQPVTVEVVGGDGGGGQTDDPATAGAQKTVTRQRNDNHILPEGAYYLDIQVLDFSKNITVNGQPLGYGGQYHREAKYNPVTNKMDFVSAVSIISDNVNYTYTASYPSDSTVDEATL